MKSHQRKLHRIVMPNGEVHKAAIRKERGTKRWVAEIPLMPGCVAEGGSELEAQVNIAAAVEKWLAK